MVVDDDERIVNAITQGLRDMDRIQVEAFTSGRAARTAMLEAPFDLIITDYRMPEVDGLTLIREAHWYSPKTVTVLMTAFGSPEIQSEAERASVKHYLEKPFTVDDLIGILDAVFPPPPVEAKPKPAVYKVVLGGDANVGKTSLIQRYCTGRFDPLRSMTVGVDFHVYEVRIQESAARLVVWDLGGQDRFAPARHAFYRGSHAVGLVFDAGNRHSFYNLMRWWREIRQYLKDVPVLLLANKNDLPRQVTREEAAMVAKAWGIPTYESSCASGFGVSEFFESLALNAWNHAHKSPAPPISPPIEQGPVPGR